MNTQFKTVLLTLLTLSLLTIAVIELTGISTTALFNKYGIGEGHTHVNDELEQHNQRLQEVKSLPKTRISFENNHYDFGTIKEGENPRHRYTFTNTGTNPLVISEAIPSCGCTVPSFSKKPIPPGGKGSIEVQFLSHGRKGANHKNILIVSNAEREKVSISFDVTVE